MYWTTSHKFHGLKRETLRFGINIIQRIGTNYPTLGTFLLNDGTGQLVDALNQEAKAEDITKAIFTKWLKRVGRTPVSWSTLVSVLRESSLHVLADEIIAVNE